MLFRSIAVGNFTPGEANELRKHIGAWNIKDYERDLNPWLQKLAHGMRQNNFDDHFIQQILGQMRGFADYGFPESHAASFARIAWASAWLKCHHPAAFYCGLLNSQPMGFYTPSQLVQDARRHKVPVAPVEWNATPRGRAPTSGCESTPRGPEAGFEASKLASRLLPAAVASRMEPSALSATP